MADALRFACCAIDNLCAPPPKLHRARNGSAGQFTDIEQEVAADASAAGGYVVILQRDQLPAAAAAADAMVLEFERRCAAVAASEGVMCLLRVIGASNSVADLRTKVAPACVLACSTA
jgi:hypothetical protein